MTFVGVVTLCSLLTLAWPMLRYPVLAYVWFGLFFVFSALTLASVNHVHFFMPYLITSSFVFLMCCVLFEKYTLTRCLFLVIFPLISLGLFFGWHNKPIVGTIDLLDLLAWLQHAICWRMLISPNEFTLTTVDSDARRRNITFNRIRA